MHELDCFLGGRRDYLYKYLFFNDQKNGKTNGGGLLHLKQIGSMQVMAAFLVFWGFTSSWYALAASWFLTICFFIAWRRSARALKKARDELNHLSKFGPTRTNQALNFGYESERWDSATEQEMNRCFDKEVLD